MSEETQLEFFEELSVTKNGQIPEEFDPTPEISLHGLLDKMGNIPTGWVENITDILCNHWAGILTPACVEVNVRITELSKGRWKFERWEANSTGRGMSYGLVKTDFFGIPTTDSFEKHGPSVHTVGEKFAYSKLVHRDYPGYRLITKEENSDVFLHGRYDFRSVTTDKGWLEPLSNEKIGTHEVHDLIGSKGTYQEYTINTDTWPETWWDLIKNNIQNKFDDWIAERKFSVNLCIDSLDGVVIDELLKPAPFFDEREPHIHVPEPYATGEKTVPKLKITIPWELRKRLSRKSKNWDSLQKKYGTPLFIDVLETSTYRGHPIVRYKSKENKVTIGTLVINNYGNHLDNVVLDVYVDEHKHVITNLTKDICSLKNYDLAAEQRLWKGIMEEHYPPKAFDEDDLREQLVKVTYGEVDINPIVYEDLCRVLEINRDYDWCKKHIFVNAKVNGKRIDVVILKDGAVPSLGQKVKPGSVDTVIEMKPDLPNGEADLDQIITYASKVKPRRAIMFCASTEKNWQTSKKELYDAIPLTTRTTFTSECDGDVIIPDDDGNFSETTFTKFEIMDLRRFGLHEILNK